MNQAVACQKTRRLQLPFSSCDIGNNAACLTVEHIPIDGPIEVVAGLGMGGGDLILEYGKKKNAEPPLDQN
jgi:hypothetical protein